MSHLELKWGTLKGWKLETEAEMAALQALADLGSRSMSVMSQKDTLEQKAALCALIDAVEGPIWNDWTGKKMSKEEAKAYVLEYDA